MFFADLNNYQVKSITIKPLRITNGYQLPLQKRLRRPIRHRVSKPRQYRHTLCSSVQNESVIVQNIVQYICRLRKSK